MEILLVDDDEGVGELAQLLLVKRGHSVKRVLTGEDCLALLDSGYHPDLILMDIFMPGKDGLQITREIKSNPRTKDIPVLLFTVMGTIDGIKEAAKKAGADGYITKPFDKSEFLSYIEKLAKLAKA
jgi:CheY-like chemotaxis protein